MVKIARFFSTNSINFYGNLLQIESKSALSSPLAKRASQSLIFFAPHLGSVWSENVLLVMSSFCLCFLCAKFSPFPSFLKNSTNRIP
mmetsp:Transcript_19137/g.22046  ORF Transcript_19137/g.22046 Transcript_19137/m.22046 type:complete len:87 (-) Transcript_19137:146-406(-)